MPLCENLPVPGRRSNPVKNATRRTAMLSVALLAAVLIVGCSSKSKAAGDTTKDAVAIVNGVGISKAHFDQALASSEQSYQGQNQQLSPEQLKQLKTNVLDSLIAQELLFQESKKEKIVISTKQVDDQLSSIEKQFTDDKEFQQALDKTGMTKESLRQSLQRSLAIQELVKKNVLDSITITPDEEKKFYDENTSLFQKPERVHARHILISTKDAKTDAEKAADKKKAEEVLAQLRKGADFAEMAKKYSDDPGAANGGDLGTFSRGQMVPEFEKAAFSLKVNQISDVVETQFGYHIIQVLEKFPAGTASFDEVKSQINAYLLQQKQGSAVQDYVAKLKKDAQIKQLIQFS